MTTKSVKPHDMWPAFPARQLTGRPYVYHAYVGHERPERTCGHDHRRSARADECAQRLAARLNQREKEGHECSGVQSLRYRGVTNWGSPAGGSTQSTPCHLTESLYHRRYRWAEVTDADGRIVGEVTKHPDTGERTRWAE